MGSYEMRLFFADHIWNYRLTRYSKSLPILLPQLGLSCLVVNHPRSEGCSLHGQVFFTFFCLSSSSIGFQTAFRSMLSIHRILGFLCLFAPGVVPCMISFS